MLFINLNLNLKQARISIQIPEQICKNKIRLEVQQTGEITVNLAYRLRIGANLTAFAFNPLSLRQFSCSKVGDQVYNLNFIIDCDFDYTVRPTFDAKCTLSLASEREMAIDWAYCCGDNQERHLQSLKMADDHPVDADVEGADQATNTSQWNQQIYNLFTRQKLFTRFLVESSNRTEYLIVHKLGNPCLIAFDGAEELFTAVENSDEKDGEGSGQTGEESVDGSAEERQSDRCLRLDLLESIFVEFTYLDYDHQPDEVKKYRHSFDYEFLKLDSCAFDGLFNSLQRVNCSILPLAAKHNLSTKFNYSYLLSDAQVM